MPHKLCVLKPFLIVTTLAVVGCAHPRPAPAPPGPPPAPMPPVAMAPTPPAPVPLEHWAEAHPEAARELGDWAHGHPQAARRLFEWDGHHHEKAHEFVIWTITHPAEGIGAFAATHRGWPFFDEFMTKHRPAAETFMAWCRRHPPAADALMRHPRGLEWAGQNLYRM